MLEQNLALESFCAYPGTVEWHISLISHKFFILFCSAFIVQYYNFSHLYLLLVNFTAVLKF